MKVIVYTTNLNNYDNLHTAPFIPDWDFIYFTDTDSPEGWQKVLIPPGDRRASRYYKINSHKLPPHDISIAIDAC